MAIFVSDEGRVLGHTARTVWDTCIALPEALRQSPTVVADAAAVAAFETSRQAAEKHGAIEFDELVETNGRNTLRERTKCGHAFSARRRAIERIGLPQVRTHRLAQLEGEQRAWSAEIMAREASLPELAAILFLRIERQDSHT